MKHLIRCVTMLALAGVAHADYLGDFAPGTTAICGQYTTINSTTAAPATLSGTPALSVYKIGDGTNSTTESTTGVTHAEDVDARTGMNRVCIDTSADGTFYSVGGEFSVVITTGTVNSVSVVGTEVKNFSLNKVAALRPATAGRTVVVDASGLADANAVKVGPTGSGTAQTARDLGASVLISSGTGGGQLSVTSGVIASNVTQYGGSAGTFSGGRPEVNTTVLAGSSLATLTGAYPSLGIIDSGTAQAGSGTTLQLRSAANFTVDNRINGANCLITGGTGAGEALHVASYVNSTDTATMDGTWPTTPDNTSTYICFGTAPGSGSAPTVAQIATGIFQDTTSGDFTVSGSAGERLFRLPNAAAGGSGGLPTVDASNAVKVQSGTNPNQISLSSGAVLLQATQTGVTIPTVTNLTNAPTSGDLTATMKTSVGTAVATAQGLLTGTCSIGSATTCTDAALTQAAASQLQDRLICFSDAWCAMLTTFDPATDTATTTKTAPSTRASKTYIIFPSTAQ